MTFRRLAIAALLALVPGLPDPALAEQEYVVKPGDSLSRIAYQFYQDQGQWPRILEANRDKVSDEGRLVFVGTVLRIPDESGPVPELNVNTAVPDLNGKQLDIVTGNDFKPYTDENLPGGGLSTEIVTTAFRNIGYDTVVDFVNWPTGYDLTKRGKFVATLPYVPTDERKKDFLFSVSLADDLTFVYWHKDRPKDFQKLDDLKGHTVCRNEGYFTDFLDEMIQADQIEFIQFKQTEDCWRGLTDGSIDFVVQGEFETIALLHDMDLSDDVARSEIAVDARGVHLIFPKINPDSEALRDQFDRAFRAMSESGELAQMVEQHLSDFFASFETSSN